jgi:Txe/YoeB family toxin of Txe-Axe toxin-antitoxin module
MAAPQDIAGLGLGVAQLKKDTAEALGYYQQVIDAVKKIENLKVSPGNYGDLISKQKELIENSNKLAGAFDNISKAGVATAAATKNAAQSASDGAKSFTQNTAAVQDNIDKQKQLKKELDDIVSARRKLEDFKGKTNFSGNEAAQLQIEKELLDYSNRELVIKKQLADLNTQLQGYSVSAGTSFQGTDTTDAAKAKALEKEETRQLNAELKNQAQYELATVGSINEAKAAVSLLTKERDKLNLTTEEGVTRQAELNRKIDEYNAFIKENNDLQGKQRLNVGNYPTASGFTNAYAALKQELASVKQELNDPALQGKQLESLQTQERLLTQLTENLNQQFNSTREELRAYQEAAKALGLTLGADSALFQDFAGQVGDAKDEVEDLQASINFNASDTKFLDGAVEAAGALAGAYGAAYGAAELFGNGSEDLQKSMVKLQSVIAIVTGLQQVQTAIQSESATMQTILAAKTSLLAVAQKLLGTNTARATVAIEAEAAAQTESVVAAEAQVVANEEIAVSAEGAAVAITTEAVATEAATAATATFAEAFAATGIGAIILAVGAAIVYLVVKMNDYANAAYEAYKTNVSLTAALKDQYDTLNKQNALVDEYSRKAIANQQQENELAEAAGENRAKQFDQQAKLLQQQKQIADGKLANEIAANEQKYSSEGVKGLDALTKAQDDYLLHYDHFLGQVQYVQKRLTEVAQNNDLSDSQKETQTAALQELLTDLNSQADGVKAAYDSITQTKQAAADADKAIQVQQAEQTKYNADEERKLVLALTEFEVSNIKSRNEQILADTLSSFDKRSAAMQSNAAADIKLAQAQLNDVLNNPESSNNDRLTAEKQFAEKRVELIRSEHAAIDKLNTEENNRTINADKALHDSRLKAQQEFYSRAIQNPNLSFEQQAAAFEKVQALQREQVIADHTADEQIKNQSYRTDQERAADEASFQQQLNDLTEKGNEARIKLQEDYHKRLQQENQKAQDILKAAIASNYQSDVDNESDLTAGLNSLNNSLQKREISLREYNQKRKDLENDYNTFVLSAQLKKDKAELDRQIAANENTVDQQIKVNKDLQALYDEQARQYNEALSAKNDLEKEFAQDIANLITTIGDAGFERQINNYEKLKQASDDYYSREIENIANAARAGSITDADAADRTTILNAEKEAAAERLDKKEREIKTRQAKFDRAASLLEIAAKAAQAEVSALSYLSNPFTAPLYPEIAALIAGIALAQITTILATPLPTYKYGLKGDKPGHYGVYGEAGAELIEKPSIAPYIADTATVDYLPARTKITPLKNSDINSMMHRSMIQTTAQMLAFDKAQKLQEKKVDERVLLAINHQTRQLSKVIKGSKSNITIYDNSAFLKYKKDNMQW